MQKHTWKRVLWGVFLVVVVVFAIWGYKTSTSDNSSSSDSLQTVTIGYQAGDPISIAKARGELKKKMKAKGYKVVFKEFQNGAAEMQAMKSGSIDYARVGDTPPITSIAQGTKITLVAAGSSKANSSGLLVGKNSGINSLSDLKGKTIAYTSNTSSQYMILKVLQKAGLSTSDVTLKDMSQADAGVAFAKGKIDAWANWDPYTAQAQVKYDAKMLINGATLDVNNRDFLISGSYANQHKTVSKLLVKYLGQDMTWANNHKSQLVTMMAKELSLSKTIVKKMVDRRSYSLGSVTTTELKEEQSIADLFYDEGITKKQVTIKVNNN